MGYPPDDDLQSCKNIFSVPFLIVLIIPLNKQQAQTNMNKPKTNEKVDQFAKFLKEFQNESDRGASILAASMLDQKLKTILEDFLINCKSTKLLLAESNPPIGTFSSRQHLANSLGLISEIVRKIRNEFAHNFQLEFSFSNPKISDLCLSLMAPTPTDKKNFKDNPRFLFINGVVMLYTNWLYREEHVKKSRLTKPDWEKITWGKE